MIKEIFNLQNGDHISSGKFSVSGIGGCKRRKYLEMKGLYKETYDSKAIRTFNIGDMFHRLAVKELMEKGEKIGLHVVASEVNIPEQKYFSGRADVILSIAATGELIICDVKSCSDWTLKEVREGKISEGYVLQMQLYLHFFNLKRGYVLFFGKHKGEVEEIEVLYDKELCEKLVKDIEDFFTNYVEKDIEPPKCDGGTWGCDCCEVGGNNGKRY
jgi:hypothetical protein